MSVVRWEDSKWEQHKQQKWQLAATAAAAAATAAPHASIPINCGE
jgi:hypothetical protein